MSVCPQSESKRDRPGHGGGRGFRAGPRSRILAAMKRDRILITGASSGIGEALALALAARGRHLVLIARDGERLLAVADAVRGRGATVDPHPVDVTDGAALERIVTGTGPFDLVFANAGVAYGVPPDGIEPTAQIRHAFDVNLGGVLNTVLPAIEGMRTAPRDAAGVRGRIVVVASVAALIPYTNSPTYCASKAAVDIWAVGTAPNLAPHGIALTSVCPGFVRTPMTAPNDFPMPGIVGVDEAVQRILAGIERAPRRLVFPAWIGAGARFVSLLPPSWREAILRRQPSKAPLPMAVSAPTGACGSAPR